MNVLSVTLNLICIITETILLDILVSPQCRAEIPVLYIHTLI